MSTQVPSITEQCEELGLILGLDGPVSAVVMQAALENETYARNLLICRREPRLLRQLLDHPPPLKRESARELVLKGAAALANWARTGFTVVEEAVYHHRLEACQQCPNLATPPGGTRLLYAVTGVGANERAICNLCKCPVARKARLTSEGCPDSHPEKTGLTRWGEPLDGDAGH